MQSTDSIYFHHFSKKYVRATKNTIAISVRNRKVRAKVVWFYLQCKQTKLQYVMLLQIIDVVVVVVVAKMGSARKKHLSDSSSVIQVKIENADTCVCKRPRWKVRSRVEIMTETTVFHNSILEIFLKCQNRPNHEIKQYFENIGILKNIAEYFSHIAKSQKKNSNIFKLLNYFKKNIRKLPKYWNICKKKIFEYFLNIGIFLIYWNIKKNIRIFLKY